MNGVRVVHPPLPYYISTTTMKKINVFFLLFLCFIPLFWGCSDDEDNNNRSGIVGAWQLVSIAIDGQNQDMAADNQIILFQENSVFKRYFSDQGIYRIGGWSIQSEMLNISVDLPAAYYIETLDGNNLALKRYDFDDSGNLQITVSKYKKVSEDLLP